MGFAVSTATAGKLSKLYTPSKKKKKGSQGALSAAAGDLCSSSCSPAPWVLRRKVAAVTPRGNTCLTQEIGTLSTFHQQPDSRSHTWKDLHQSSPGHSHPKPVDHYYIEVLPLSPLFFFFSFRNTSALGELSLRLPLPMARSL